MKYIDFINQTLVFPTTEFRIQNDELYFHDINLIELVEKYGTPLKISYLPKISENIKKVSSLFEESMKRHEYDGKYTFCYCTKSSHFKFVLDEVLNNGADIETSSTFDIHLVRSLYNDNKLSKDTKIICNGFKRPSYTSNIIKLINKGFVNCIPILDNMEELEAYEKGCNTSYQMGLRVATDELPNFEFYTSRLGVRYKNIKDYYLNTIMKSKKAKLRVLHFFVSSGMRNDLYFWEEFNRFAEMYCELRKICNTLTIIDIGGGLPIKSSLSFEFDYTKMIDLIVSNLKEICNNHGVPTPDILTEFGSYTVGESGALLYSVLNTKLQNDKELWYIIDGSFITHLPDSWGINQKYILLPLNQWSKPNQRVNLGGITCDSKDYYSSEANAQEVYMPVVNGGEPMYLGFFHTGAYQESLGGYGGIQHCLVPSPKHVIIDKDEQGNIGHSLFREEEGHEVMLSILGY